jgi:hypothetical protein
MSRADVIRIVIVLAVLAPLVAIQAVPGLAPAWMGQRWAGVPGTVLATTAWFVIMMLLSAVFARQQIAQRKSGRGERGEDG